MREEGGQCLLIHLTGITGQRHILFLVHCLQLSVEAADDTVLEAVRLNLGPVLHLVAGDIFSVASHIEAGVGIGTVGTDGGHQLVIFIGDGILRSFVRQAVDRMIDSFTLSLVSSLAVNFKGLFDLVEQRLLYFIIHRAEMIGSLEHQVFEVVSQTGSFGRVIFTTHTHGDVGLDARFVLVDSHVHFQAVVQRVDARLERVVGNSLVAVLRLRTAAQAQGCQTKQRQADFLE